MIMSHCRGRGRSNHRDGHRDRDGTVRVADSESSRPQLNPLGATVRLSGQTGPVGYRAAPGPVARLSIRAEPSARGGAFFFEREKERSSLFRSFDSSLRIIVLYQI